MTRTCFFCRKPLPIERRHTVFCSLRCEQLHARLAPEAAPQPPAAPPKPAPR